MNNQNSLSFDECKRRGLPTCKSGKDGECNWKDCPQIRDDEPKKTGRHCPLDWDRDEDYQ